MSPSINGVAAPSGAGDVHGQAALLLVESLIHELIARSVLPLPEAIKVIDIAAEAQRAIGASTSTPESADRSLALLLAIAASLGIDVKAGESGGALG